jgi:hypothetical protein
MSSLTAMDWLLGAGGMALGWFVLNPVVRWLSTRIARWVKTGDFHG